MTKLLRGALVGCGFFAQNHLHGWAEVEGVDLVAVCDLDEARARAAAEAFGAEAFTDAGAMLAAAAPDFVDVATTAPTHRTLVETALGAGAAAICQKPFAETMADAEAMVAAAEAAGRPLLVHENFRWQRPFREAHRLMTEGRIGRPHSARLAFRHFHDVYAAQPYLAETPRLAIMDVGLHLFDLARRFMGEVEAVSCLTQHRNPRVRGEDAFAALLAHEGGRTSVVECSFATHLDPEPFPETEAVIEGSDGSLTLSTNFRLTLHRPGSHESMDVEPPVPPWGARPWHGVQESVVAFQTHARDAILGRVEPQPSGADNLRTLAVAMAAYESAETGRTVVPEARRGP